MNDQTERRRRMLKKLSKLLAQLSVEFHNDEPEVPDAPVGEGKKQGSRAVAICTPKSLPDPLQIHAAKTAVRYNPLNAPAALGALRGLEAGHEVLPPARIAVEVKRYWGPSQRVLTVSFLEETSTALRDKILSHMNAWNKTAGISFQYTQRGGNVRITRAQPGYWSYVGTDILHIRPSDPTMSLQGFTVNTRDEEYRRVVRHETGHTLGFPHEHLRREFVSNLIPERCYEYYRRTQGWNRAMVDAQVLTPLEEASIFSTPPDQTSIMCYQIPAELTRNGKAIPGGSDINRTDYWFAGSIYPKPGAQSSPEARFAALADLDEAAEEPEEHELASQTTAESQIEESGFTAVPLAL